MREEQLIRKQTYPLDRILPHIGLDQVIELDEDRVKVCSLRLLNFKKHGISCEVCGIKGSFFAKEKHHKNDVSYHLNLYAIDGSGKEILMTRDHIVPRTKGGKDILVNLQTMCTVCNCNKDAKLTASWLKLTWLRFVMKRHSKFVGFILGWLLYRPLLISPPSRNRNGVWLSRWDRACEPIWQRLKTGPASEKTLSLAERNHARLMSLAEKRIAHI